MFFKFLVEFTLAAISGSFSSLRFIAHPTPHLANDTGLSALLEGSSEICPTSPLLSPVWREVHLIALNYPSTCAQVLPTLPSRAPSNTSFLSVWDSGFTSDGPPHFAHNQAQTFSALVKYFGDPSLCCSLPFTPRNLWSSSLLDPM